MSRIVVTGGAGYVGLPLCRQLVEHGHEVIVIDNGTSGPDRAEELQRFARLYTVDVTDSAACSAAILEAAPETLVHLAAIHFVPECNRRPVDAVRVNVLGTQNVLDSCSRVTGLLRVLITSSAAVYPVSDAYFRETDPPGPTDIYGTTKAANEWQAQRFASQTGVSTVAVRLFNVFGPGETNPHLVPDIIDQVRAGRTSLALGNTSPKRSYVYIDDVVDGFEAIMTTSLPDTFSILNLGHRDEASVLDLLQMMSLELGVTLKAEQDPERTRPSDRPYLRCDPDLTRQLTGWQARYRIEEGVRKLLSHECLLC